MPCSAPAPLFELPCHAQTPDALVVMAGAAWLPGGGLRFTYRLDDAAGRLHLPPRAPAARRDGLWQHTCCEAFLALPGEAAYREFNFSPSGAWAAYAFSAYRQRLSEELLPDATRPALEIERDANGWQLAASLPPCWLPATGCAIDIGLAVVVETGAGQLSYRALRHVAPRPDFHQRESFALCLPAPSFRHENRT